MLHSDVVSWYLHPGRAKALRHSGATSDKTHGSTKEASQITVLLQLFQLVTLHLPFSCHNFQILSQFLWQLRFHVREFATQEKKCCWCWCEQKVSVLQLFVDLLQIPQNLESRPVGQNMAWHDRAGLQAPHAWMNTLNSGSYIPSIQLCTRVRDKQVCTHTIKVDTYFLSRPTLHAHMISHDMTGRSIQKFSINYPWLLGASQKFMSAQLQVKIYAWANLLRLMHTVSASMTLLSSTFQSNRISARIDSCLATVSFRKFFKARNYRDTHIQFWSPPVLLRITFSRNTEFGQDSLQPLPSFAEACSLILSWERLLWPPGETLQVTPRNNQDKLDNWT